MAVKSAQTTVVGMFNSMDDAQRAFDALKEEGFSRSEISFIANKKATRSWGGDDARTDTGDTASDVAADAGIGAALGGVGGLLLSFAGLAIPGIGPVLATGPIVAALGGAGIGAAAGGIIGALTESGIPEKEAHHYAEGVRRGDILMTVRTDDTRAERAAALMDDSGAVDIDRRVSNWRERGWERHDASAQPLSADELLRERDYLSNGGPQGGSTTTSDSVSNGQAVNAKKDAERTSDTAENVIATGRRDVEDTSPEPHMKYSSDDLAGEHDFRSATEPMPESAKYHGDKLEHAGERAERSAENLGHRMENAFRRARAKVNEESRDARHGASRIFLRITG